MNSLLVKHVLAGLLLLLAFARTPCQGQELSRRNLTGDRAKEQRAASLARMGHVEAAVDLYLELLYKNPRNSNLYFRVSSLMPGKEYAPTLLQILDDLLKSQSGNQRLAAERGRLLYLIGKKEAALQDWEQLISNRRTDRYVYTAVTNAMLQAGALDEAIDHLIKRGLITVDEPTPRTGNFKAAQAELTKQQNYEPPRRGFNELSQADVAAKPEVGLRRPKYE